MSMQAIPYGKQQITKDDIDVVITALQSDYLTQGPAVAEFEKCFAEYIGAKYAVAVCNGTAALHLSAMALGVSENSNVITTPITFAASANCVRYCGGNVWFADINPETYTLDINKVEELILSKPAGFFQGIIPVDFAGYPVDLEAYKALTDKYNLWIIEDACHAPGAYFIDSKGEKQLCGNGVFANLAVFSFHPVKHIATGEGGMITTNDQELYQKLLMLRTHGIVRDEKKFLNEASFASASDIQKYPGWYMEMLELGYNYRITDIQAALGVSQLKRAAEGLDRRGEIAKRYDDAFRDHKFITIPSTTAGGSSILHAYHLYVILVPDRLGLYEYLREEKIFAQVHYIPAHLMPYYRQLGWKENDFPAAEDYYTKCLSLPMYPSITTEEHDFVIQRVLNFFLSK